MIGQNHAKTIPATAYFNEEMKLIKSNDGSNNKIYIKYYNMMKEHMKVWNHDAILDKHLIDDVGL